MKTAVVICVDSEISCRGQTANPREERRYMYALLIYLKYVFSEVGFYTIVASGV